MKKNIMIPLLVSVAASFAVSASLSIFQIIEPWVSAIIGFSACIVFLSIAIILEKTGKKKKINTSDDAIQEKSENLMHQSNELKEENVTCELATAVYDDEPHIDIGTPSFNTPRAKVNNARTSKFSKQFKITIGVIFICFILTIALGLGLGLGMPILQDTYYYDAVNNGYEISVKNSHKNRLSGEVTIPSEYRGYPVVAIKNSGFTDCAKITSLIIPSCVISIGNNAFQNCTSLEAVAFEQGSQLAKIGDSAFADSTNLTLINIPESVTFVGGNAFQKTAWLDSQPNGLVYIGKVLYSYKGTMQTNTSINSIRANTISVTNGAFQNQTGLVSIVIPNSVTTIDNSVFNGCSSLKSVSLPFVGVSRDSVGRDSRFGIIFGTSFFASGASTNQSGAGEPYRNEMTFFVPASLREVIITDTAVIRANAFISLSSLTSITIPDSVKTIGYSAFQNCSDLTSIIIPDSVMSIGSDAFRHCNRLTNMTLPFVGTSRDATESKQRLFGIIFSSNYSATSIVKYESDINKDVPISLKTVIITDAVTIDHGAFIHLSSVESIIINEGVISIGYTAFGNCTSLTSIIIPSSVISISVGAFNHCTNLTSISVGESSLHYVSINGVLYNKEMTELLTFPAGKIDASFVVPSGVSSIANEAFLGLRRLSSITISNSVMSIGRSAFGGCIALNTVIFEEESQLTIIGSSAFAGTNIILITIPNSVTTIGYSAFSNCKNLTSINALGHKEKPKDWHDDWNPDNCHVNWDYKD